MRYFAEISYLGTHYHGWQKQPNALSVQQVIEEKLSMLLRHPIEVIGCGRTDTGVHAQQYVLHFDTTVSAFPPRFLNRLNRVLPADIAFHRMAAVPEEAHARFDADYRAYEYHLSARKNPFKREISTLSPDYPHLSLEGLNEAAALLGQYEEFFPFCKANSDAKTMKCQIFRSEWVALPDDEGMVLHIAANRFLRGMVRLIVGMCIQVGTQQISLEAVRRALDQQTRLDKSFSVPAEGLSLTEIRYPYEW